MSTILLMAATAVEAIGAIRGGNEQAAASRYNARVLEAQAASTRATSAFESETLRRQSELEQSKISREKERTLGLQRAAYAKAGVRLDEGSPLEVFTDTAAQYELDLSATRYNLQTGLEKIRYESETSIARDLSMAAYQKQLAKQYKTSGYLGAGTTLLTGGYKIGKAKGKWN